ncbi:Hercynine oxygenase [Candidatus Magnetaquicoccaceae bacterium FCR-1]|uniref:Hercynine oxygenase n=1 Tax=Candidatus Magnetaquiglobus chichijimensis TaxID=3141448 RepID=A0ABQ0CDC4_9PROT
MHVPKFAMSRFPVTRIQYWLAVQCCVVPPHPEFQDEPDYVARDLPVTDVTFAQARAFAKWVGGDLPTVTQWEYVAMNGNEKRLFPWGADLEKGKIPPSHALAEERSSGPLPVGSWPAGRSAHGVEDLCGNVFEWCLETGDDKPVPAGVIKGGSYFSPTADCKNGVSQTLDPLQGYPFVGFRVVWPVP